MAERQSAQEAAKAGGMSSAKIAATSAAAAETSKVLAPEVTAKATSQASVSSDPVTQAKAGPNTMTETPKVVSAPVTAPAAQK